MSIKSILAKPFAKLIAIKFYKQSNNAVEVQQKVFKDLITKATNTTFGKDHTFSNIKTYEDFKKQVPVGIMKR